MYRLAVAMALSLLLAHAARAQVDVKSAEIHPASQPAWLPPTLTQRDVTVGGGTWALPGTLTLPRSGRPRAGIVFVHGSGPNDRDETIGLNKPFRDLAWGLGVRGIATLRYDKRTRVHRDLMLDKPITLRDEVLDDAVSALDALRRQPELAGVPIILLGHSLGASLAPEIALRDGKVAGVVMLAGTARPYHDVLLDQCAYLASLHQEPDTREKMVELNTKIELLRKHMLRPGETVLYTDATYWYDLETHDGPIALKHAAELKCPVLVVQGGRDYQATSADFNLWRKAFADNPRAAFKLFDNLNRLFQPGQGKATPGEYTADHPVPVDPRVIDLIAAWCPGSGASK